MTVLQRQILKHTRQLNSFQLIEVLDFIQYLGQKKNISASTGEVNSVYGKYADALSSSEDFSRRKKGEILLEAKKWSGKRR